MQRTVRRASWLCATVALTPSIACHGPSNDGEAEIARTSRGLPKGSGGTNGDVDYCISSNPCLAGEGDCDYDGHCVVDTYCANNVGSSFGFSSTTDVCVDDTCLDGFLNGNETDVDCGPGCLPCVLPNGHPNFCTSASPCQAEQGDCDYNGHCVTGTYCANNVGTQFGFSASTDVCVDNTCFDGLLNGNETGLDCGPGCAPCVGSSVGVERLGGAGDELVAKVVTDGAGDRILAGSFRGTTELGTGSITAFGTTNRRDVWVAKRRPGGSTVWARRFGGTVSDGDGGVAVSEALGTIAVAGNFHGTADFGAGTAGFSLTSAGSSDIFVVAMNSNGVVQWATRFGGTGYDAAYDVEVDAGGNIQVVGSFEDTISFGSKSYTSRGDADAFVVRLAGSTGAVVESTRFGGTGRDIAIAADSEPNRGLTVGGTFSSTATFDGVDVVSAGFKDAFVTRLNPYTLRTVWRQTFGGVREDVVTDLVVDSSDRSYVTGYFMRAVDFGGGTRTATSVDTFTLSFDASGNYRWDEVMGTSVPKAIAIDRATGTIATAGHTDSTSSPLLDGAAQGNRDVYLLVYDSAGVLQDGYRDGGGDVDEATAVTLRNGEVFVAGHFSTSGTFAGQSINSAGQRDLFLYSRVY